MKKYPSLFPGILACLIISGASGSEYPAARGPAAVGPQAVLRGPVFSGQPAVAAAADYGRMPIHFIANGGQLDTAVDFYIPGSDKSVYFSPGGLTIAMEGRPAAPKGDGAGIPTASGRESTPLPGKEPRSVENPPGRWAVKLDFLGANPDSRPRGENKTEAVVSYFRGDREDWKTGLPTYSRIVYSDLWPGIDLVYSGTFDGLKYEFVVRPGADPAAIRSAYRGASEVAIDAQGRLQVTTPAGGFADDRPAAYQEIDGRKTSIPIAYALENGLPDFGPPGLPDGTLVSGKTAPVPADGAARSGESTSFAYGFKIGDYDRNETLVIDPAVFVNCGFVGGNGTESGAGIAVDGSGNAYITGSTISTETTFPVAAGPDLTHNGGYDVFVAKVNAAGTGLVYCGFIGGDGADYGNGIAVDAAGCAYVAGTTDSNDTTFPVTVGPDLDFGATGTGGYPDAFIAKLNAAGTGLDYCGYIGGRDEDRGYGVAVDGSGCAYITGFTTNNAALFFPVLIGPDLTHNGSVDAFVTKVNASGTGFVYSGYIGGDGSDYGHGIAVDGSGRAYVAGVVYSDHTTFPAAVGPDLTFNGVADAFVARVSASGAGLDYCGFIGGSEQDIAYGIAVDGTGCAYVTGVTFSTESTFPVIGGPGHEL